MKHKTITDPEILTIVKAYVSNNYGSTGEIKEAYEDEYFYGGYDGLGDQGIFILWEDKFNEFGGHYLQFIDVTVNDLINGETEVEDAER